MSFYNMLCGMNAELALLVSPFLPRIPENFPRFRDVFLGNDGKNTIHIYTRMGGGNRDCWREGACTPEDKCVACEADELEKNPLCYARYDDSYDCTYCTFVFGIPEEWFADFQHLKNAQPEKLSQAYWAKLRGMYSDREKILEIIDQLSAQSAERK